SAPFSLLTYQDVKQHVEQIVDVTSSRFMPPWLPKQGHGEFAHERRLNDEQLEQIRRWVEAGAPEGDLADLPEPPQWAEGWQLGEPDLVVTMPEPYLLQAEGVDVFRNFVLPVPISKTHYVKAVEFRPGNPRVVHHLTMQVDPTPTSQRLDEKDAEPGYPGMLYSRNVRVPDGQLLGWTPGKLPHPAGDEMAWRIQPGTDLVLQLHMLPGGKPEPVQVSVGFFF
ncbi:unnamed protein product, partial [marine sediment metagenome]